MDTDPDLQADIRRFEEQYAENPESLVFARLADLYRKAGDPGRGLELLEEGLEHHPDYASGHIVRGRCLRDLDRADAARRAFEKVLELDGQNLVALRSLAELARERGDLADARGRLETILDVDPRNEDAREMLVELSEPGAEALEPGGPEAGRPDRPSADPVDGPGPEAPFEEAPVEEEDVRAEGTESAPGPAPDTGGVPEEGAEPGVGVSEGSMSAAEDGVTPAAGEPEDEEFAAEPVASEPTPEAAAGDEEAAAESAASEPTPEAAAEDEEAAASEPAPEEGDGEPGEGELPTEGPDAPGPEGASGATAEEESAADEEVSWWRSFLPGSGKTGEETEEAEGAAGPDREPAAPSEAREEEPGERGDAAAEPTDPEEVWDEILDAGEEVAAGDDPEVDLPSGDPEEDPGPDSPAAGEEDVEELRSRLDDLSRDLAGGEPGEERREEELATETLAGLYEAQGFYREAVEMYEELLEQRPDDDGLRERLERAREALEETGAVDREPAVEPEAPEPGSGPAGSSSAGEPSPPEPSGDEPSAPPAATARDQLRALLHGRAVPWEGPGPEPATDGSGDRS